MAVKVFTIPSRGFRVVSRVLAWSGDELSGVVAFAIAAVLLGLYIWRWVGSRLYLALAVAGFIGQVRGAGTGWWKVALQAWRHQDHESTPFCMGSVH